MSDALEPTRAYAVAMAVLAEHLPTVDPAVREELATRASLSDWDLDNADLDHLEQDDIDSVALQIVAENPHTPIEVLLLLATSDDFGARAAAARHPHLPAHTVTVLASDANDYVRASVASRPDLDLDTFHALATDAEPWVVTAVAENPRTPPEVLDLLLVTHSGNRVVCDAIARNPNASEVTQVTAALSVSDA